MGLVTKFKIKFVRRVYIDIEHFVKFHNLVCLYFFLPTMHQYEYFDDNSKKYQIWKIYCLIIYFSLLLIKELGTIDVYI